MRVVWLLGGEVSHLQHLSKHLRKERTGVNYLVRHAQRLADIPEEHVADPGTVILLDAFHPDYMGLGGIEDLAAVGAKARCFLLGEPAREQSQIPFSREFFCGYFPPLDRVDFAFLSGAIHHVLYLDGKIEIKNFLLDVGKSSVETIQTMSDFVRFEKLLRTFATKFKVDGVKLKKLVMAITLQHTRSQDGKISIQEPYPIYFGIDPKKLVLAVPTMSRGRNALELRSEFTRAVSATSDAKLPSGAMCPELFHSAHAGESLLFLCGTSKSEIASSDPCYLVTRVNFPPADGGVEEKGFAFLHHQVVKTEEHDETWAKLGQLPETQAASSLPPKGPPGPLPVSQSEALKKILEEPIVAGDPIPPPPSPISATPKVVEATHTNIRESDSKTAAKVPSKEEARPPLATDLLQPEVSPVAAPWEAASDDVRTLNMAIYELNQVCSALSKDVHVLMKSRREPTTDKELRAAKEKLEENIKRLSGEVQKYQKIIKDRDAEIVELKERIKRLMSQVQKAA